MAKKQTNYQKACRRLRNAKQRLDLMIFLGRSRKLIIAKKLEIEKLRGVITKMLKKRSLEDF